MLRIGDFAKIARVSVKTLHHYDEIDLLKPNLIQAATGYRYYSIDQLPRLNRILALKDLGFTLNQIRSILNENLSPTEIRAMLRLKEAELANLIQEEQERLDRVKVRLRQIEHEDIRRDYDILIKPVAPQAIVSARKVIPITDDAYQQCQELAIEVFTLINRLGGTTGDRWFSLYHETTSRSHSEWIDIEMATEVERSLLTQAIQLSSERLKAYELPGTSTMACLLYQGQYDGLWDAYIGLATWLESSSYRGTGPLRCIYLRVPPSGGEPLTELQIPIQQGD